MALKSDPEMGINSWLEDELYQQYLRDRSTVDESWKHIFEEANGRTPSRRPRRQRPRRPPAHRLLRPRAALGRAALQPLRGAAGAHRREHGASVTIPLATSQRIIPVKVIDENRRLINHHRALLGKSKVSYTHLIGWAIVKCARRIPR